MEERPPDRWVSKQLNGIAGTLLRSPAYLRGLQSVLSMHVIVLEDGRATVPEPAEPADDPGKYEVRQCLPHMSFPAVD